jgi:cytoskeletal protein CcmA (bactofilin family)
MIKEGGMKQLKWAVGLLLLAIVPVLAFANLASAQKFSSTVDKGQTVNSTLYSTGKDVEINGTINGDVFCAGQTVRVDATVHGDVICAGQDVTISGKIDGNVRVAGQTVSMDASVGRSATVAAMTFSLDAPAKVGQDLTATGSSLNIKGMVTRDVVASGNEVILNGPIGRNAKVSSASVHLRDSAVVAGNLEYTSSNKLAQDKGATVKGSTKQVTPTQHKRGYHFNVLFYLFALSSLLLISLVLAYCFPNVLRKNAKHLSANFTKSLLVGLIASFLFPAIALGLCLTLVGMPLAVVMLLGWLLLVALSGPIVAYYVGERILKKRDNLYGVVALGSLVLVTAYFVPLIGILVLMLAYWLGTGALLLSIKEHMRPSLAKAGK